MLLKLFPLLPMLALLIWAAVGDIRNRRIPNWLTLSLMVSGIARSFLSGSALSPLDALLGLLVGFIVPFLLFAIGAVGGGDVKILAGIGAWLGWKGVLAIFVVEKVVGLIIVLVQCAVQGNLRALFRNSAMIAINVANVKTLGVEHVSQTGQSCRSVGRRLPFAVPLLAATLIVLLAK